MLNLDGNQFKVLKEVYNDKDMEETSINVRRRFSSQDGFFSVFDLFSLFDTLVILHDDKDDPVTRYITFKISDNANYLILSAGRTVEEMRFDAACMLRSVMKSANRGKGKISLNCCVKDKAFSREDKHFACALLMPEKELMRFILQKDERGNYKYINKDGEISFKNINAVADYFGVPFGKCSSRIYHVFEKMRKESKYNCYIEGCYNRTLYKKKKAGYTKEQMMKDKEEVCPNHQINSEERTKHLIDSLHYRPYDKLSEIAKRKILINLIQYDAINEKVVDTPEEVKQIINEYIASGGTIDKDGKLITGNNELILSDEQLIVVGEYDLSEKILKQNLITSMMKYDPTLEKLKNMSYKDAINSLTERDMCFFIKSLHRDLFKRLEEKYDEVRGGFYRNYPVYLPMTGVTPVEWTEISYEMQNLSYRILCILKDNVNGKLSNCEYIERVNKEIYNMIRMQPFQDGNKRTSKLLSNILYQEKGLPYTLVSVDNYGTFVDGWRSNDTELYNKNMYNLILESYNYFYGDQSVNEAASSKINNEKIINANRGKKR